MSKSLYYIHFNNHFVSHDLLNYIHYLEYMIIKIYKINSGIY